MTTNRWPRNQLSSVLQIEEEGGSRLFNAWTYRPARLSFSAAATAYLDAVGAADGEELETFVYNALGTFAEWRIPLGGCCLVMGAARTSAGALVPLVGPAPTLVNLSDSDYARFAGFAGNGTDGYINTNYSQQSLSQDDAHAAVALSAAGDGIVSAHFGTVSGGSQSGIHYAASTTGLSHRMAATTNKGLYNGNPIATGLHCLARDNSADYDLYINSETLTVETASAAYGQDRKIYVLASQGSINVANNWSRAIASFYSFGPFISPTTLEAKLQELSAGLAAADPAWTAGGSIPLLDLVP